MTSGGIEKPTEPNGHVGAASKALPYRYVPDEDDEYHGPERRRRPRYNDGSSMGGAGGNGGPSVRVTAWISFAISLGTGIGIAIAMFQLLNEPIKVRMENISSIQASEAQELRKEIAERESGMRQAIRDIQDVMGRSDFVPERRRQDMLQELRRLLDSLQMQISSNENRLRRVEAVCVATGRFCSEERFGSSVKKREMSRIHLSYDTAAPDVWTLDRPYERDSPIGPIVVPQGFKTDLASTPRVVWRMYPRWGRWSGAAIVHDWIYRTHPTGVDRWQADRLFLDLMRADGVARGDARVIYRSVREFGDTYWNTRRPTDVT